jgi:hypothetical protein
MRILDIDLDFFLNEIQFWGAEVGRLDPIRFVPWRKSAVRAFLRNQCGLSKHRRLRGKLITTHDEAFFHWRDMKRRGDFCSPFQIVHVDAHADLGMGDASYAYIQTELLHGSEEMRMFPVVGDIRGLGEGNYLAFAIACGWIDSIQYVHHENGGNDLPPFLFKDNNVETGLIRLKRYPLGTTIHELTNDPPPAPIGFERDVPIEKIPGPVYRNREKFDIAYLSRSPGYTPSSSDELIDVFAEYLDFG